MERKLRSTNLDVITFGYGGILFILGISLIETHLNTLVSGLGMNPFLGFFFLIFNILLIESAIKIFSYRKKLQVTSIEFKNQAKRSVFSFFFRHRNDIPLTRCCIFGSFSFVSFIHLLNYSSYPCFMECG